MDQEGFRLHLRRMGKKEHVVEGLVGQVRVFEAYLAAAGPVGLEAAGQQELRGYVETLDPKAVKKRVRGLALYYGFAGNEPLARLAGEIREQRIAETRKPFKLRAFRGVELEQVARLEAIGIVTVQDAPAAGRTPGARRQDARGPPAVGRTDERPYTRHPRPGGDLARHLSWERQQEKGRQSQAASSPSLALAPRSGAQ